MSATPTDSPRPARPAEHEELVQKLIRAARGVQMAYEDGGLRNLADRLDDLDDAARRLREARGGTDG